MYKHHFTFFSNLLVADHKPKQTICKASVTYEEAGPEGTRLAHPGGGGERQAGEAERQDHGTQTEMTQAQVEEQPGAPTPTPG